MLKEEYEDEYKNKGIGKIDVVVNDIEVSFKVWVSYFIPITYKEVIRVKKNNGNKFHDVKPDEKEKTGYYDGMDNRAYFRINTVTGEARFHPFEKFYDGKCTKEKNL